MKSGASPPRLRRPPVGRFLLVLVVALVGGAASAAGPGSGLRVVSPSPSGRLVVHMVFQGDRTQLLDAETPGRLRIALPEKARVVRLALDRPDLMTPPVSPLVVSRKSVRRIRRVIVGGVVEEESFLEYEPALETVWGGIPPGEWDVLVETVPESPPQLIQGVRIVPE